MPPIIAGAGGLLQGALGFFRAKQQQKEAKRQAELNDKLASNDTRFGAFSRGLDSGRKVGAVSGDGPSALGGALSGALAGVQQGANIYQGMQQADMNALKLKAMKDNPYEFLKLTGGKL